VRLDRAQRRHLAAVKQLALVRKLLRPALSPVQVATRLGGAEAAPGRVRSPRHTHAAANDN
jgi:hypothetical protein